MTRLSRLAAVLVLAGLAAVPGARAALAHHDAPAPVAAAPASPGAVEFAPNGAAPDVIATARGNWAAWTRARSDGAREVVVARLDAAGHAGTPFVVSAGDSGVDATSRTRLAAGPDGALYVLYTRREAWSLTPGGRGVLRLARAADGAHFAAPVDVTTADGPETSAAMAALAVSPDGAINVAWLDERDLVARAKLPPEQRPVDSSYTDEDDPRVEVRFARSTDGGAHFGASVAAGPSGSETSPLNLVAGRDGTLVLAWRAKMSEFKGSYDSVRDVWTAASSDGGAHWSAPAKIHNDRFKAGDCPGVGLGLALDAAGHVMAAWYDGSSVRPGVFAARADAPDTAFAAPQTLLADGGWVPYANVALAVDGRQRTWVAFEDKRDQAGPRVVLLRLGADGTPTGRHAWPGTLPALAAEAGGVRLVWQTPGSALDTVRVDD